MAVADAIKLVRSCHGCQFYAKQTHLPAHALQMIPERASRPLVISVINDIVDYYD